MIEIKLSIDAGNQAEVNSAIAVLQKLVSTQKRTRSVKKEEVVSEEEPETEPESTRIQLSDLRKVLALKVKDHREDIKSKLTELEAKNLTTLAEEKYPEFETFLNDLS
jgi:hypothetical protein